MDNKYFISLILICLVIGALLGCGGINTVTSKGTFTYTKVGDLFLNDQVGVSDINVDESSGVKVYNVQLQNFVWYEMILEVKMDFYDAHGVKLDNPWGWKPITLEEEQSDWIKFISPNNQAVNFKLYIQKAGN